ncbi:EthD family reductase [Indioceanicola profundi]|uniref:EthD family reductase n=1 Tax=Indioceanicola profundi TaxID=2220096 RepID=UPI000E6AABD0|nr:EthD family reductase [Indioceanicola profundi]
MHKLVALYGHPKDPAHFKDYYERVHVPLAQKMPGLQAHRFSYDVAAVGGDSPYFCIFEGEFADADAMNNALSSPEGQAVAGDISNYASGGVTLLHYSV